MSENTNRTFGLRGAQPAVAETIVTASRQASGIRNRTAGRRGKKKSAHESHLGVTRFVDWQGRQQESRSGPRSCLAAHFTALAMINLTLGTEEVVVGLVARGKMEDASFANRPAQAHAARGMWFHPVWCTRRASGWASGSGTAKGSP